jgi:hypothetical protein
VGDTEDLLYLIFFSLFSIYHVFSSKTLVLHSYSNIPLPRQRSQQIHLGNPRSLTSEDLAPILSNNRLCHGHFFFFFFFLKNDLFIFFSF